MIQTFHAPPDEQLYQQRPFRQRLTLTPVVVDDLEATLSGQQQLFSEEVSLGGRAKERVHILAQPDRLDWLMFHRNVLVRGNQLPPVITISNWRSGDDLLAIADYLAAALRTHWLERLYNANLSVLPDSFFRIAGRSDGPLPPVALYRWYRGDRIHVLPIEPTSTGYLLQVPSQLYRDLVLVDDQETIDDAIAAQAVNCQVTIQQSTTRSMVKQPLELFDIKISTSSSDLS